jgi:site-specific DNA recombinase
LENVIYIGKVLHHGKVYPGEHEGIIDENTWNLVQDRLRKNDTVSDHSARNRYGALLRGLLYCSACHTAMVHTCTASKTRRYRYYVCLNAQQHGWASCPTKSLNAQQIEDAVVEHVRGMARNEGVLHETVAKLQEQAESHRTELKAETRIQERDLKRVRSRIREVAQEIVEPGDKVRADGVEVLSDLQNQAREIEQRIAGLHREMDVMDRGAVDEKDLTQALSSFDPIWDELTPGERTRIIRLLVERVGFDGRDGKVIVDFHSEGIKELCRGIQGDLQEVEA